MQYPIVLGSEATIDVGRIAKYRTTWRAVLDKRYKLKRLKNAILQTCNLYVDGYPDLKKHIASVRREIRLVSKGTSTSYNLDYVTGILDFQNENANEQLTAANQVLLKSAYRKVASLAHPDNGGDAEIFHEVYSAYKAGDLVFLQELFLRLTSMKSLFWQSNSGVEYALQEVERVHVLTETMKLGSLYKIYYLHVVNRKADAISETLLFLQARMQSLQNELNHLLNKGVNHG